MYYVRAVARANTTVMMRLWTTGVTGFTVLFGLLIGGVHLLPVHGADLEILAPLFDEACAMPCAMGIRPDVTPVSAAMSHLNDHTWVEWLQADWNAERFARDVILYWTWSGAQPVFIDDSLPGMIFGSTSSDDAPYPVIWMTLPTKFRLYDLQVALGQATGSRAFYDSDTDQIDYSLNFQVADSPAHLTLEAHIPCPAHLIHYWHSRASISFSNGRALGSVVPPQSLAQLCP